MRRTVWVTSTRLQTTTIGQLKNLSRSGALIAECDLQLFSLVHVMLQSHPRRRGDDEAVAAYVTRVGEDGVGVEWCDFAPTAVTELLQAAAVPDGLEDLSRELVAATEMPPVAELLERVS